MISRKQEWKIELIKHIHPENGFPAIIKKMEKRGIFDGWERIKAPGMGGHYLGYAIEMACVDYHHPYVQQFLNWSVALCERGLADPRFEIESDDQFVGWKNESYFDCHGLTLETLALANAFKKDADIDVEMFTQATKDKTDHALKIGFWDAPEQFSYLVCVQFYLIIGNIELARALLKTRKKFKQVQRHYDWLKALIDAIPDTGTISDAAVITAFQERFDEIRSPLYQPSSDYKNGLAVSYSRPQLWLQLALIKQRYIIGKPVAGHWQEIIGYISE